MQISIDTREPITEIDAKILEMLLPGQAPAVKTPANKAPASKKPEPAVPAEPDSAPAAEEEEPPEQDLRQAAVAKATQLVSQGKVAKVKEALATVAKVEKLSQVPDAKLAAFIEALDA